jgi:hypothetical protein
MDIHRYKWHCYELENSIKSFAMLHRNTHKLDFNEHFEQWYNENKTLIDTELRYINSVGYDGDIYTKILSSVKYYHIKKLNTPSKQTKSRSKKERIDKDTLTLMKGHIDVNKKPSITYDEFLNTYDLEDTELLKKAYKNQYYQLKLNKK